MRKLNLLEDFSSLRKFDIIFCRNVAIYFNKRDRSSLFIRMADRLESDGTLNHRLKWSLLAAPVTNRLQGKEYVRSVVYQRT